MRRFPLLLALPILVACERVPSRSAGADGPAPWPQPTRLPTGATLDPAAPSIPLGSMPLAATLHPGGRYVAISLDGWREQGVQIYDRVANRVTQTLIRPGSFLGLAFTASGDTLFASGGVRDVIYVYSFRGGSAVLVDSMTLAPGARPTGERYPAGIALAPNGRTLYVAENLADSIAVLDLAARRVVQRVPSGRYPYGVLAARSGAVYASAWGDSIVNVYTASADGRLSPARSIVAGRHPSAMLLDRAESRLFVASASTDRVRVFDTGSGAQLAELRDPPPAGPGEGSTPNALALAPDESRLYVAEADANAVAVFDLAAPMPNEHALLGRVPVEWYPTALVASGDSLLVVSGKGRGTAPDPDGPTPYRPRAAGTRSYTLGQLDGSLMVLRVADLTGASLGAATERVAVANGWSGRAKGEAVYPPFQHVVYVIKENRTYDQMLGDLSQADGDTALALFPRATTPNHHALAERFGILDRFFVNAEVSADGHNWSTAAYATDYVEKTVPSNYSDRGRTYDYEGTNGGFGPRHIPRDDAAEPASGYLWDLADRAHISFRNYGEFVVKDTLPAPGGGARYIGNKPFLATHTSPDYPGFDLEIPDQHRADVWIRELVQFSRDGSMPALEIIRLPNDHTSAMKRGALSPRALVADNDLALGRMIAALSASPFWKSTVVFVLEDDAQNGPDHVDSHRSPLLVISPYNAPGVYHRFANTSDVIATIAEILHLGALSQFDYYGRPLRDVFGTRADLRAYTALRPRVDLAERNPSAGRGAAMSAPMDLREEDRADDEQFNEVLWRAIKGDVPYPGAKRASALEVRRAW